MPRCRVEVLEDEDPAAGDAGRVREEPRLLIARNVVEHVPEEHDVEGRVPVPEPLAVKAVDTEPRFGMRVDVDGRDVAETEHAARDDGNGPVAGAHVEQIQALQVRHRRQRTPAARRAPEPPGRRAVAIDVDHLALGPVEREACINAPSLWAYGGAGQHARGHGRPELLPLVHSGRLRLVVDDVADLEADRRRDKNSSPFP